MFKTLVVVAALAMVATPSSGTLQAQVPSTVKVTVQYTGKGTVDATHKVWVYLFDTPNIGAGSIPIGQVTVSENGAEALFENVSQNQVWLAAAFDEKGLMGGDGPPPSGTPIAIWAGKDGAPLAITPGKAPIVLKFDDTMRMP
ncbi:MAG TPA: hypothetical protein VEC39_13370 [Vicinamibacterales bacterium]|nr:hypothetical protein [Vicinamibacterales bacterium]